MKTIGREIAGKRMIGPLAPSEHQGDSMRLNSLLIVPLLSVISLVARADTTSYTTYTYVGDDFTFAEAPFTTNDKVTGSFTMPTLGDNLEVALINVDSFNFSDGV